MQPNAFIEQLKQQAAAEFSRVTADLPSAHIVIMTRLDQPRVSDLRHGRLKRFSLERLLVVLNDLGHRADVTFTKYQRFRRRPI